MTYRLPGVPAPIPRESPVSWMQRISQVFDLSFQQICKIFTLEMTTDLDLCIGHKDVERIATICNMPASNFEFMLACFGALQEHPKLSLLLLVQEDDRLLYRYCPQCLACDAIPFMRLEWRFSIWQYCPIHRTPMQCECQWCSKRLALHRTILGGRGCNTPVFNLAYCFYCRQDLRGLPSQISPEPVNQAEMEEKITFQQAIVSAVLHGHFIVMPMGLKLPLSSLYAVMRLFNYDIFQTKRTQVRKRKND